MVESIPRIETQIRRNDQVYLPFFFFYRNQILSPFRLLAENTTQIQTNSKELVNQNQEIQTDDDDDDNDDQQQLIVIINPYFISNINFLSLRNVLIDQCMKMLN